MITLRKNRVQQEGGENQKEKKEKPSNKEIHYVTYYASLIQQTMEHRVNSIELRSSNANSAGITTFPPSLIVDESCIEDGFILSKNKKREKKETERTQVVLQVARKVKRKKAIIIAKKN